MALVQVELDKVENKIVEHYKIDHDLLTKAAAIKELIRRAQNENSKSNKKQV